MNLVKPMLAASGQPFNSEGWIFEPKIDGTRCIAEVFQNAKGVRLNNRRLFDITSRYPELALSLAQGASGCVLDGEITVFGMESLALPRLPSATTRSTVCA